MNLSLLVDGVRRCGYTDEHGYRAGESKADGEVWMNTETEGGRGDTLAECIEQAKEDCEMFLGSLFELKNDATGEYFFRFIRITAEEEQAWIDEVHEQVDESNVILDMIVGRKR